MKIGLLHNDNDKMVSWNKDKIISNIRNAVDTLGRVDWQRLRQWNRVLQDSSPEEVFEALYSIFTDETRPAQRFLDQEYAGKLLWSIKPPCAKEPVDTIRAVLRNYDFSIEELPWYFAEIYGQETVVEVLNRLKQEKLSEKEQVSVKTFLFWLRTKEKPGLMQPFQEK
jgi:hypothetical protein